MGASYPLTQYIPSITALTEQTLITYISSSLFNGGTYTNSSGNVVTGSLVDPTTQWYTGIANSDVEGPAVLAAVNTAQETYFQTRVYRVNADISTRMIAADSQTGSNVTSSAISLAGNVFSLFADTNKAAAGINALSSSLAVVQVQVMDFKEEKIEDAWLSNINVNLIAYVCPS